MQIDGSVKQYYTRVQYLAKNGFQVMSLLECEANGFNEHGGVILDRMCHLQGMTSFHSCEQRRCQVSTERRLFHRSVKAVVIMHSDGRDM